MASQHRTLDYQSPPPKPDRSDPMDFWAYLIPMGIFMLFTWIGSTWKQFFVPSYICKAIIVPVALLILWKHYTKIRWDHWLLGIVFGILGLVQWVGMEKLLMSQDWLFWTRMSRNVVAEAFNPFEHFDSPGAMWTFIAIRWAAASLVVPVMEELFWRDFLWRSIAAPNDFKLAQVGEYDRNALLLVPLFFATVHVQWLTAIVWGFMVSLLLLRTKSLGACIIMHGVTNFFLGVYVLHTREWFFW